MALVRHCHETTSGTGFPLTINKPTSGSAGPNPKNVAAGDLIIILVSNDGTEATALWDNSTNKPTGFTFINESGNDTSDTHCAAFYRIADGTEGSTFSIPAAVSHDGAAICILYSGADATTPINVVSADSLVGSATSLGVTGATTTVNDCKVNALVSYDGADEGGYSTSGTGWAEVLEARSGTTQADESMCWSEKTMSGQGATGTCTFTVAVADGLAGFQFAIAPGAATGAVLEASVSAAATIGAALTTAIPLLGSLAGAATIAAALTTAIPLLAAVSGAATQQAALTTAIPLQGSVSGSATVAADLSVGMQLDAAASCSASTSASLTTQIPLLGAVSGTTATSGALTTAIPLGGSGACSAATQADLTAGSGTALDASASCSALTSATLTTQIPLLATASGSATTAGALTTQIQLAASASSTAIVAGDLVAFGARDGVPLYVFETPLVSRSFETPRAPRNFVTPRWPRSFTS